MDLEQCNAYMASNRCLGKGRMWKNQLERRLQTCAFQSLAPPRHCTSIFMLTKCSKLQIALFHMMIYKLTAKKTFLFCISLQSYNVCYSFISLCILQKVESKKQLLLGEFHPGRWYQLRVTATNAVGATTTIITVSTKTTSGGNQIE